MPTKELQREGIAIDIFGSCSGRPCTRNDSFTTARLNDCGEGLEDYKFVIAFENALCRDYVTEKLFLRMDQRVL